MRPARYQYIAAVVGINVPGPFAAAASVISGPDQHPVVVELHNGDIGTSSTCSLVVGTATGVHRKKSRRSRIPGHNKISEVVNVYPSRPVQRGAAVKGRPYQWRIDHQCF